MDGGVWGMTGTAATQADELREIYGLQVVSIPTHRPVARGDQPDVLFATRADKEAAVAEGIKARHATGQPGLVGTASGEESQRLSPRPGPLPHHLRNPRHEAREAGMVARARGRGAATLWTKMR